jgi:stage II sporulation protein E
MTVNDVVQRLTASWRSREWRLKKAVGREELVQLAAGALHLIMGFVFARAGVFGGYRPFGVGLIAAAGGGLNGVLVLAGIVFGHVTGDAFAWAMKYIGIGAMVFAANSILGESELGKNKWFPALIAATFTAGIGFVFLSDGGWNYRSVIMESGEVILAALSALSFKVAFMADRAKDMRSDTLRIISIISIVAVTCIALEGLKLFGMISVGRIAAVLFLLLVSSRCGSSIAGALGLGLGIALDAGAGSDLFFAVALGAGGLTAGALGKRSRLSCAVGFVLVSTLLVVWMEETAAILYEGFIAGVIFLILPDYVGARVSSLFPIQLSGCGAIKAREYTKTRVEQMALAFGELYDSVQLVPPEGEPKSEAAGIFDRAAEKVCRLCPDVTRCWERDSERTLGVMEAVTPRMFARGSLSVSDFPESFSATCPYLAELTAAINEEVRVMMYRRQYKSKLMEKRGAVYNQYADISAVLKSLAGELGNELTFEPELERKLKRYLTGLNVEANAAVFREKGGRLRAEIYGDNVQDLRKDRDYLDKLSAVLGTRLCTVGRQRQDNRMLLLEAEPLAVSVGIAAIKKKGQEVSGDHGTYFKTEDGTLYILLSDGMGTGEEAAACSESAVRILERFLRAGVPPETSMRILNDLMLLKNETETVSASVVLMWVELFSGVTGLYKFGAAPSYVRRGDTVKRMASRSLSTGLGCVPGESPDYVKMRLEPDSFAVIVSDGVSAGEDDGWLRMQIAGYRGTSAKELAREILALATARSGCEDDKTVLVIYVEERK